MLNRSEILKEIYHSAEIDITRFDFADVIATSAAWGGLDDPENKENYDANAWT